MKIIAQNATQVCYWTMNTLAAYTVGIRFRAAVFVQTKPPVHPAKGDIF